MRNGTCVEIQRTPDMRILPNCNFDESSMHSRPQEFPFVDHLFATLNATLKQTVALNVTSAFNVTGASDVFGHSLSYLSI
jgi:hypothetical protein